MRLSNCLLLAALLLLNTHCRKSMMEQESDLLQEKNLNASGAFNFSATDLTVTTAQASTELWPASRLNDGNVSSIWSAMPRSSAGVTEWIAFWFNGFHNVNYVKLFPRMGSSAALGFPVGFNVFYSNGPSWVPVASFTHYYTPQQSEVVLRLPATVNANGIHIVTTELGKDDVNNFVFQLGEVTAGYEAPGSSFNAVPGVENGWDIFTGSGYRYGPSIIRNSDGSIDAWFAASPSTPGIWDEVAYKRSTNGGITWSAEQMVLSPTPGSRDAFSICDPAAVKFGGYYYIGYTSTEDSRGLFNHVYVARSTSPTGPWQKWNGTGWGGNPQPVVTFNGNADAWGAGEPSMVVYNNTLYFYYTWTDVGTNETRVATVSASNANWPAALSFHGTAINKTNIAGADHCDVKYRDDLQKFQAVHTASRLTANSYIMLWESTDGITFTQKAQLTSNLKPYLHNCGWSGDEAGHINPTQPQFISYAYGPNWADWKTAWHPLDFIP
ncbi:MAG: discoidin domain-containing protein [Agriterribacter sp.]